MHTHMSVTNVQIRRAPRVLPIDGRDMGGGVTPWIEAGSMIRVTRFKIRVRGDRGMYLGSSGIYRTLKSEGIVCW